MTSRKRNRGLIAIVDNDPVFEDQIAEALTDSGFEVIVVTSGYELLSVLSIDRPSVIIMDTMLSWIDGPRFLEALQRNPFLRDTRVIFTSRRGSINERIPEGIEIFYKPGDIKRLIGLLIEEDGRDGTT